MKGQRELAKFPEKSFFATNCIIHGSQLHPEIDFTEEETGEAVNVKTVIRDWLDGNDPVHANDDVTLDNPSCYATYIKKLKAVKQVSFFKD